jgi:hypothetical protein
MTRKKEFDVRVDRGKSDEDGEVDSGGTVQPSVLPQSPNGEEHCRHNEEQEIETINARPAEETLHLTSEDEEHVHLDREPDDVRWRMDKGVGRDLPKMQIGYDLCAVEGEQVEECASTKSDQKATQDHGRDVHDDQESGDIDGIASHPSHRLVIIRNRGPKHHNS